MHRFLALLALLGLSTTQAIKLELPAFLNTVAKLRDNSHNLPDFWFNPLVLLPKNTKPTVQDNTNAYARWGDRRSRFTELAIWRTTNGKAIVGINTVFTPRAGCGDYPCGPAAAFLGWDGTRYVDPPDDTLNISSSCKSPFPFDGGPVSPDEAKVYQTARARLKSYGPYLRSNESAGGMCIFPQHGTTITVAVLNTDLAFAYQGRVLPLYYYRFDKVKGTFTMSASP
ncbi:hypothetical protein [Deinococcus aquaedulcis]|uniref:hypothetical protein n=1 Tax=Deinococcus aquaedulcis TaxID=2840455 RepID=UPI001C833807|nr:hypothetical protein [Deinococcus aquaedulcis]